MSDTALCGSMNDDVLDSLGLYPGTYSLSSQVDRLIFGFNALTIGQHIQLSIYWIFSKAPLLSSKLHVVRKDLWAR